MMQGIYKLFRKLFSKLTKLSELGIVRVEICDIAFAADKLRAVTFHAFFPCRHPVARTPVIRTEQYDSLAGKLFFNACEISLE